MRTNQTTQSAYRPRHLGQSSRAAITTVDRIPWSGGMVTVCLACKEFTSLCPVTGQPDFGTINIRYAPRAHIVETKSLKLYLMQYRDRGVFNEALVAEMAEDLYRQIKPHWIEVTGQFQSRGGIAIEVTAKRPAAQPEEPLDASDQPA